MISGPKSSWTLVTSGVLQGPILLNFFVNDPDNGTECTLSKSVYKLGVANTPNGRAAIHRDLDWVKNWAERNSHEAQQSGMQSPASGQGG